MLRTASVAAVTVLALGGACRADTVYSCVPDEQRATAPDCLVSVEITLRPDGEFASVVYKAANGAFYSRGQQYETTNHQQGIDHYWTGRLRANHNVSIVGSLHLLDGRLVYYESIHDRLQADKIVAHVASVCDGGRSILVEATPPTPPAPAPSAQFPDREFKAFVDCVDAAAVALATISTEPAQTVVDAALGECPHAATVAADRRRFRDRAWSPVARVSASRSGQEIEDVMALPIDDQRATALTAQETPIVDPATWGWAASAIGRGANPVRQSVAGLAKRSLRLACACYEPQRAQRGDCPGCAAQGEPHRAPSRRRGAPCAARMARPRPGSRSA